MSGQRVDVKVVMLGKEYVGKTSLVERYVHDRFLVGPYQNTIGAAFVAKVMCVGDRTVTLGIWDTAGSERYEAMSRIYYRGAKAAIVCYDLTDSSSFERAKFWVKELRSLEEGCQIYLCGTKSDLLEEDRRRRRVDFHDVQDYADNIKAQLFETSSKTGQSVARGMCPRPLLDGHELDSSTGVFSSACGVTSCGDPALSFWRGVRSMRSITSAGL